jgi:rod shape-determining protein MreC
MFELLKNYKRLVISVVVLLIPLILLSTQDQLAEEKDKVIWYERALIFLTAPFQSIGEGISSGTGEMWSKYFWLAGRYEENMLLRKENLKLRGANFRLKEIEQENKRLRELLKFKKQAVGAELLAAEVIAVDAKSEFKSIRINRGEVDGVKEQFPVVTSEGIVGQVLRVYRYYADVLLITDRYSFVDAIIQRIRTRGVLEGDIERCNMKYVLRTDQVEKGDVVISSGLDLVFPKGLPLGYVSDVKKEKFGTVQEVKVTPVVDFGKLEEVLIVLKQGANSKLEDLISDTQ